MSTLAEAKEITGEFRTPINMAATAKGSIHDDATASKLGFKGGTVAGSVHMDQYVPVVTGLFGQEWLSRGNISLYFKQATVDREVVRAFGRLEPGKDQAHVWMENEAGDLIGDGTASCKGPDENTELSRRVKSQSPAPAGALRIFKDARVGAKVEGVEVRASKDGMERRISNITEPQPHYSDESLFGGLVLPPSSTVQLYRGVEAALFARTGVVGLFGAIELQTLNGPILADKDYVARAEILALTESPKTENVWYKAFIADKETGEDAGWMIMYLRMLKASSPLYNPA